MQVGARQTGPKALNYWSVEANGNWHTRQHVSAAWQVPLGAARLHILGCDCPHFPTKEHPEAVLGDFKHDDPVRTFGLDQVAFVYGSRWKQRYFTRRGDDYYPLPAQWDVKKGRWLQYHVESGTDWWVPFYGPTNFDRPTGPTCDGCHSVNYNIERSRLPNGMSDARSVMNQAARMWRTLRERISSILRHSIMCERTIRACSATARAGTSPTQ